MRGRSPPDLLIFGHLSLLLDRGVKLCLAPMIDELEDNANCAEHVSIRINGDRLLAAISTSRYGTRCLALFREIDTLPSIIFLYPYLCVRAPLT